MTDALVIRADAFRLPLADETVDLIVTSPPYWGLRSYTDAGRPLVGQLGTEATPGAYLERLWAATREMVRVLKPAGSIFVNLGDKYAAGGRTTYDTDRMHPGRGGRRPVDGARAKSLLGLPWAYALGCTGNLAAFLGGRDPGLRLILRGEIVWAKPNALPESVKDRVRRTHESWLHLTKRPHYYAAVDELRQRHARWWDPATNGGGHAHVAARAAVGRESRLDTAHPHRLGALPGSVWSIATEPLRLPAHLGLRHYAAYPSEWPRRLILGWSPPGVCTACGQGRWPVTTPQRHQLTGSFGHGPDGRTAGRAQTTATIRGYACACTPYTDRPEHRRPSVTPAGLVRTQDGAARQALGLRRTHLDGWPQRLPVRDYHLENWTPPPTRPAIVLDPFGGTGTTAMVATALGRIGVSIDLSFDYSKVAQWRIFHGGQPCRIHRKSNQQRLNGGVVSR